MHAMVLPRFGDPGVFTCEEVARPVPADDQMLPFHYVQQSFDFRVAEVV